MATAPPALTRLKALGFSQRAIAQYIGASTSAVSAWFTGKNPFEEPWRSEAEALLAVASEHLAQGRPLATLNFRPTVFMNVGGTTRTGEGAPIEWADLPELAKLQQELAGQPRERFVGVMSAWHACATAKHLAKRLDIDPRIWQPSAEEVDELRRMVKALDINLATLLHEKARKALEE